LKEKKMNEKDLEKAIHDNGLIAEMNALQEEIHKWREENFPIGTDTQMALGVSEEFGELAKEEEGILQMLLGLPKSIGKLSHGHLKQMQQIRVNEDHWAAIKDAVGDIVIYLMGYCSFRKLSLAECLLDTWMEVRERSWQKFKATGTETEEIEKTCPACGEPYLGNGKDLCIDCEEIV
jgi:NTP pyrophosphatase (non-canonical NTP hydrolase)